MKKRAGMTDAEFRAESGMSDDAFERTAGTGIEEHAGPTTTVEIADPLQPRALTPIEAAAEQAAFDKSPGRSGLPGPQGGRGGGAGAGPDRIRCGPARRDRGADLPCPRRG